MREEWSVAVVKRGNLLVHWSIYVSNLSYDLCRVAGLSRRDGVKIKLLLLHNERRQMRWFGNLVRMPPGRLPTEVLQACSNRGSSRRRALGGPRKTWVFTRKSWEGEAGEVEVWTSLLRLLRYSFILDFPAAHQFEFTETEILKIATLI